MNKLVPGQKLYYEKKGEIKEAEIESVGRKYLKIKNSWRTKILIVTLIEFVDCGTPTYYYLSKQEIIDKNEKIRLIKFMQYDYDLKEQFTLDQLRRIKAIMEEKK